MCRSLAREESVLHVAGLAEQLLQAADKLEGPWQQQQQGKM
jgi:hypothetical protein